MDNLRLKVENIVAKGEIACFEQFLLLSLCFQKADAAEVSESVYMRERVTVLPNIIYPEIRASVNLIKFH